jgi:hypothetical protein
MAPAAEGHVQPRLSASVPSPWNPLAQRRQAESGWQLKAAIIEIDAASTR